MESLARHSPDLPGIVRTPANISVRWSCDLCKRMKIKCERRGKSCTHCATRNLSCTVTVRERKKRIGKRAKEAAAIEERIRRMETTINTAGLVVHPNETENIVEEIGDRVNLSDEMSTLAIGDKGVSAFIGASSAFSFFSQRGVQWMREKTKNYDTEQLLGSMMEGCRPRSELSPGFWHPRADSDQTPLPTKDMADAYVNAYFHRFNSVYPIYEETYFRTLYERQYSFGPPGGAAWYASLNAIIALGGTIFRADRAFSSTARTSAVRDSSWMYLRNACSKLADLLFESSEIMAVQALVLIAFILQAIPEPNPVYILIATAVRLSHALGLHRSLDEFGLDSLEKKQRQNVFWNTYVMDVGISLRSGRPPAMSIEDIAVPLPQTKSTGFDHFRSIVTLSLLESRVYSHLYSAKAATRSGFEQLKRIGRLDTELLRWRDTLPPGYQPDTKLACPGQELDPVIMLHFRYYNCLTAIHRASVHHGSWLGDPRIELSSADLNSESLNPRVFISSSLCLEAVRNVIGLLQRFNESRDSLIFTAVYYPLSAALALFANILHSPQSTEAFADFESIGAVMTFLQRSTHPQRYLQDTMRLLTETRRIAVNVIRDAQMVRVSQLRSRGEEMTDINRSDVSQLSTEGLWEEDVAFPIGDNDIVPLSCIYSYDTLTQRHQSQILEAADSFKMFPYDIIDVWTENGFS